jgi:hypothetical protein
MPQLFLIWMLVVCVGAIVVVFRLVIKGQATKSQSESSPLANADHTLPYSGSSIEDPGVVDSRLNPHGLNQGDHHGHSPASSGENAAPDCSCTDLGHHNHG